MRIDTVCVGPIQTNCYLLQDETAGVCALIDPGDEASRLAALVEKSGCRLQYILLTHGHFDHYTAVPPLLKRYGVPVYIHRADTAEPPCGDLVFPRVDPAYQRYCAEGDCLDLGDLTVRVLETPGHTAGSVCYLCQDVLFSGDTLFRMSCGRTDLPGGSFAAIRRSLARLAALSGDLTVYPGHDAPTTLEFERSRNPYMPRRSEV